MPAVMTIKCAQCGREIFKFIKKGKGRLWHCWKDRMMRDENAREGRKLSLWELDRSGSGKKNKNQTELGDSPKMRSQGLP